MPIPRIDPLDVLKLARHAAESRYAEVRAHTPDASFADVLFIAMNVNDPHGSAAATKQLVEEGNPLDIAEKSVAARAADFAGRGFAILARIVPCEQIEGLLDAARCPADQRAAIVAAATTPGRRDELRVVVISAVFELTSVGQGPETDLSKLN